ncbi:MAG: hypothetical protein H6740_01715 [Alphaproteobacteria bacterium]|nr:hypothetical protein [Alphaproteobacteria bacterium]
MKQRRTAVSSEPPAQQSEPSEVSANLPEAGASLDAEGAANLQGVYGNHQLLSMLRDSSGEDSGGETSPTSGIVGEGGHSGEAAPDTPPPPPGAESGGGDAVGGAAPAMEAPRTLTPQAPATLGAIESNDTPPPSLEGGAQVLMSLVADRMNDQRGDFLNTSNAAITEFAAQFDVVAADVISAAQSASVAGLSIATEGASQLSAHLMAADERLRCRATQASGAVDAWSEAAGSRARSIFQDAQAETVSMGEEQSGLALQDVETQVGGAEQDVDSCIDQANSYSRAPGGGGDPVAAAQLQARQEVIGDTTDHLDDLQHEVGDFRGSADDVAEDFGDQASDLADQMEGQAEPLAEQLGDLGVQASDAVNAAPDEAATALAEAEVTGADALTESVGTWSDQLLDDADSAARALAERRDEAALELQEQVASTAGAADVVLEDLAHALRDAPLTEEDGELLGREVAAEVELGWSQGTQQVVDQLGAQRDEVQPGAQAIVEPFHQAPEALSTQVTLQVQEAGGSSVNAADEAGDQLDQSVTEFVDAGDSALDDVSDDVDSHVSDLEAEFVDKRTDVSVELGSQVDPLVSDANQSVLTLPNRIQTAETRASERAQGGALAWVGQQLSDLWNMVSDPGFIASVVTGLLLVVAAVLLLPEELGLLAIIGIGALIGAIAMGVGAIVSNLWNGRPWYTGLGEALLLGALMGGLGALLLELLGVGLLGLISISLFAGTFGIITNLIHGEPWDKNLLANLILAPILVLIGKRLGSYARNFRPGGTTDPVPLEDSVPVDEVLVEEPVAVEEVTPEQTTPEETNGGRKEGCFVAGTLVHQPSGLTRIETMQVDDEVHVRLGEHTERANVAQTTTHVAQRLYTIFVGPDELTCSAEHPFWVVGQGWVPARMLRVGQLLKTLEHGNLAIRTITVIDIESAVYNLEVDTAHMYHVGVVGVLVHNKAMRWTLQDRAAGLRSSWNELSRVVNELPESQPMRWNLRTQLDSILEDIQTLAELAETTTVPEELSVFEDDIVVLEDQLAEIANTLDEVSPVVEDAPDSNSPRPHLKHPKSELPTEGTHPYEPPKSAHQEVAPNPQGKGYIDANGNVWEWAHDQHGGPHWDVQHPDGSHTNVYPDGEVYQGADNF